MGEDEHGKRRRASGAATAAVATALLVGCGGDPAPADDTAETTEDATQGDEVEASTEGETESEEVAGAETDGETADDEEEDAGADTWTRG